MAKNPCVCTLISTSESQHFRLVKSVVQDRMWEMLSPIDFRKSQEVSSMLCVSCLGHARTSIYVFSFALRLELRENIFEFHVYEWFIVLPHFPQFLENIA